MSSGIKLTLMIVGLVGFVVAGLIYSKSESAVHEVEALVALVVAVTSLSGAGIIEAIHEMSGKGLKKTVSKENKSAT